MAKSKANESAKPQKDVVALTLRLPRAEWLRLHTLALSEASSVQSAMVEALNLLFKSRGQRAMKIETHDRVKSSEG